jgi:hypothetical protein
MGPNPGFCTILGGQLGRSNESKLSQSQSYGRDVSSIFFSDSKLIRRKSLHNLNPPIHTKRFDHGILHPIPTLEQEGVGAGQQEPQHKQKQ